MGLKHFLALKEAEKQFREGKEVDELKRAGILAIAGFVSFELKLFPRMGLKLFLTQFLSKSC